MARLDVNPNRMELNKLREKLSVAKHGHKLLKDKQDVLIQQFMALAGQAKVLRREVEAQLRRINASFVLASAMTDDDRMLLNLSHQADSVRLRVKSSRLLNLKVPVLKIRDDNRERSINEKLYPHSFQSTSGDMDLAALRLRSVLPLMIELAEKEHACQLLSHEIKQTRRRVNSLELRIIVDMEETIEYITMQINENERNNISRLMKTE